MAHKRVQEKIIRVSPKSFLVEAGHLVVLVFAMICITAFVKFGEAKALALFFCALMTPLLIWSALSIKIGVTPEQVQYKNKGLTITSKWKDIVGIETRPVSGLWTDSAEGLTLGVPGTVVRPWPYVSEKSRRQAEAIFRDQRDFIPLSMWFGANWREGEIGAAIREYAPHLLDPSIKLPEISPEPQPLTLKALLAGEFESGAYRIDIVEWAHLETMAGEQGFRLLVLDGKTIHNEYDFFQQIKALLHPLKFNAAWFELEYTLPRLTRTDSAGVILVYRDFHVFMEANGLEFDLAVDTLAKAARSAAKIKSGAAPLYVLFESQTEAGLPVNWL